MSGVLHTKTRMNFKLAQLHDANGTNVLTYGFPFTHRQKAGDRVFFDLQGRYLEGYVGKYAHIDPLHTF